MIDIKSWFRKQKQKRAEYNSMLTRTRAEELIQVKEFSHGLWLTYNGHLVCPMTMFKEEPIKAICEIRSLFVARNCDLNANIHETIQEEIEQ